MSKKLTTVVGVATLLVLALAFGWLTRSEPSNQLSMTGGVAAEPRPYLRLAVSHDATTGAVTVTDVTLVETPVRPLTGPGGFYAVLDGADGVLSAVPFSFSAQMITESEGDGVVVREVVDLTDQSVITFLPYEPQPTGVRVLDQQGTVVASVGSDQLENLSARDDRAAPGGWWPLLTSRVAPVAHAAAPIDDLEAAFPHIDFLLYGDELNYGNASDNVTVEWIDYYMAEALHQALSSMGPVLVGSIGSVAMVSYPGMGLGVGTQCSGEDITTITRGQTVGNQILINVNELGDGGPVGVSAEQIRSTLTHEAVHAFHNVVDGVIGSDDENLPLEVQTKIDDVRDNLGYVYGALSRTWRQMQGSARIAYDGYGTYVGGQAFCDYPTTASAVEAGFARPYGAYSHNEDVATFVQMFYDNVGAVTAHPVCQQFSGLTNEVPEEKLLPFAKLNFLRGIEMITEADYQACAQNADPADQDGFELSDANYDQGLKAGSIGQDGPTDTDGSRFVVLGSTSTAQAMLQIYVRPPFYTPVGFHRLDKTAGWLTPYVGMQGYKRRNLLTWQPTNVDGNFELTRQTRISSGGFALVVNNTSAQTKGYAFFVTMEDWQMRERAMLDLIWFRIEP